MINVIQEPQSNIIWADISGPTEEDIQAASSKFNIDAFFIKESMNPEHFPRFDIIHEKLHFLILRLYDDKSTLQGDTVRELTRKVAIFYGPEFILTIHRRDIDWLEGIRAQLPMYAGKKNAVEAIVTKIIQETIARFESPIQTSTRSLEDFEVKVFMETNSKSLFQDLYLTRRKAVVFREMIDQTAVLLTNQLFFQPSNSRNLMILKRIKGDTERLFFYSNKLYESISYLINLHISLSSQRTNEVMRVLTVFSAFFLPLTFIVGIYGMNFEYMPELKSPYGYIAVLAFMAFMCLGIYIWFRKKGWLKFQ